MDNLTLLSAQPWSFSICLPKAIWCSHIFAVDWKFALLSFRLRDTFEQFVKENVTNVKIAVLVQLRLKMFSTNLTEMFYLLLLVEKMPPGSRLQSYAPHAVKGKVVFFIFLASFLAVYKGQRKFFLCVFCSVRYSSV